MKRNFEYCLTIFYDRVKNAKSKNIIWYNIVNYGTNELCKDRINKVLYLDYRSIGIEMIADLKNIQTNGLFRFIERKAKKVFQLSFVPSMYIKSEIPRVI